MVDAISESWFRSLTGFRNYAADSSPGNRGAASSARFRSPKPFLSVVSLFGVIPQMNKLVLSALAATVAVGTTSASESDWAGLDAELNSLTTALDSHEGGASDHSSRNSRAPA